MLKDYRNKQQEYEKCCEETRRIQTQLEEAREAQIKAKRELKSYCSKNLKECAKAGYIIPDAESPFRDHYLIKDTKTSFSIEANYGTPRIVVFNYDRDDYFAAPLEEIKIAKNVRGGNIWSSLSEKEKKTLEDIIDLISI